MHNRYNANDGDVKNGHCWHISDAISVSSTPIHLQWYMSEASRGWVVQEMLFDFTRVLKKKRRPDLAFVSYDRWPKDKSVGSDDAWHVVPNLVVDVVGPTNTAGEVMINALRHFADQ